MNKFKNFIGEYHNLLTEEFCEEVIKKFEDSPELQMDGKTMGGVNKHIKDSTDISIPINDKDWKNIDETLFNAFGEAIQLYANDSIKLYDRFKSILGEFSDTGYQIQSYDIGGKYIPHVDSSPVTDRLFAGILYLNPSQYTGGETVFPYHDWSIKPANPGSIVIFPTCYPYIHTALPVLSGKKYIVTTFYITTEWKIIKQ